MHIQYVMGSSHTVSHVIYPGAQRETADPEISRSSELLLVPDISDVQLKRGSP